MLGAMNDMNNNEHLLEAYYMPGAMLCALPIMLSHNHIICEIGSYYTHFPDEETET